MRVYFGSLLWSNAFLLVKSRVYYLPLRTMEFQIMPLRFVNEVGSLIEDRESAHRIRVRGLILKDLYVVRLPI